MHAGSGQGKWPRAASGPTAARAASADMASVMRSSPTTRTGTATTSHTAHAASAWRAASAVIAPAALLAWWGARAGVPNVPTRSGTQQAGATTNDTPSTWHAGELSASKTPTDGSPTSSTSGRGAKQTLRKCARRNGGKPYARAPTRPRITPRTEQHGRANARPWGSGITAHAVDRWPVDARSATSAKHESEATPRPSSQSGAAEAVAPISKPQPGGNHEHRQAHHRTAR